MFHWFGSLGPLEGKVNDSSNSEPVEHGVNHTVGNVVVGWVGEGEVLEGRGLHRTHTNVLARHKGIEVDNISIQDSVAHLAVLDLVVGCLVDGDVHGEEQHLLNPQEGLPKHVLVKIPLGLQDRPGLDDGGVT